MKSAMNMDGPSKGNDAFESVEVSYYAGYKGKETPRRLLMRGRSLPVLQVLSRERVQDSGSGQWIEVFELQLPQIRATLRVHADGRAEIVGRIRQNT